MKYGIALTTAHGSETPPAQQLQEYIEVVRMADSLGFEFFSHGQHVASDTLRFYQPIPLLARLSVESKTMKVATGILLLPLFNPVDIAEQLATLDVVTGGRLIFGTGLGYTDREFEVFGLNRRQRASRFEESLAIIQKLWAGEEIDHQGKQFSLPRVRTTTLPSQQPRPPIWIAGQAEGSIRRAARLGDAWWVPPFLTHDELIHFRAVYNDEHQRVGKPVPEIFPVRREFWIASTKEQAVREAHTVSEVRYSTYVKWGIRQDLATGANFAKQGENDSVLSRFIVGSPEECAEQILGMRDRVGMTHLVLKPQWPGLAHKETMRQLEIFGSKVMPLVK